MDQSPPSSDPAPWSLALAGFYACCAMVSAGAGMFFFSWFVLTDPAYGGLPLVLKILGGVGMSVGIPGAFYCLHKARQ